MDAWQVIIGLAAVIGAMAGYIVKIHREDKKERKDLYAQKVEDVRMMTEALVQTKSSVDNNTAALNGHTEALKNVVMLSSRGKRRQDDDNSPL